MSDSATVVTRTSGDYSALYLVTGTYTINAAYRGFRASVISDVMLTAQPVRSRHNDRLDSGSFAITVT